MHVLQSGGDPGRAASSPRASPSARKGDPAWCGPDRAPECRDAHEHRGMCRSHVPCPLVSRTADGDLWVMGKIDAVDGAGRVIAPRTACEHLLRHSRSPTGHPVIVRGLQNHSGMHSSGFCRQSPAVARR